MQVHHPSMAKWEWGAKTIIFSLFQQLLHPLQASLEK
jgi:hypothetical protein